MHQNQNIAFFLGTGIFLNKELSWEDRDTNKQTVAVYPLKKDDMETNLWRVDFDDWCQKLPKAWFSKEVLYEDIAFFRRTGTYLNKQLSLEDREINKESVTVYSVEKDGI